MKKDRHKLEDNLLLMLQDYSNDTKIITEVTERLIEKNIPRSKVIGMFTQAVAFPYISEVELCLFTKYFYNATHEYKIKPDDFFNDIELQQAELYQHIKLEKTNQIVLHNVDQINDHQWLCTKETYQNMSRYFENGLLTYNPKTQRQPLKHKIGSRIVEVININPKKIAEIKQEMLNNTFNTNAILFNVRRISGMEKIKYNAKDRTLIIEKDDNTFIDLIDGMHRMGGMLKVVEEKPDIDRVTSIYIYYVDEEKARQIIHQEAKTTPIDEEWIELFDVTNPNLEVVKNINSKQRMNEMFNKIALDHLEMRQENKLVTFETLSKTIEYFYNLKDENKSVVDAQNVEKFLIELFNIVISINHSAFNKSLYSTRKDSYIADNNTFIGYIALGEKLRQLYPENWQDKLEVILKNIDFSKPNSIWKTNGLENNLNLTTIKKISEYFQNLI